MNAQGAHWDCRCIPVNAQGDQWNCTVSGDDQESSRIHKYTHTPTQSRWTPGPVATGLLCYAPLDYKNSKMYSM